MDDSFIFINVRCIFETLENASPSSNDPFLPNPAEALDFLVEDHMVKLVLIANIQHDFYSFDIILTI
jgi:hypothetical protein